MDSAKSLLVSVRPRFAGLLLDGAKTVELRRVRPAVMPGAFVLIYASSPFKGLVGSATVAGIDVGLLDEIWNRYGGQTGISRAEYDAYFAGISEAVAIELRDIQRLSRPRLLPELRRIDRAFRPPQSFRYLDAAQVRTLV